MKKKKTILTGILAALLLLLGSFSVQAAAYKWMSVGQDDMEYGGSAFSYRLVLDEASMTNVLTVTRNQAVRIVASDPVLSNVIVTNGKVIYYQAGDTLYQVKYNGTGRKKILTKKTGMQLTGCYGGRIYYQVFGKNVLRCYDIKTGKDALAARNVLNSAMYAKYVILYPDYESIGRLSIYNAQTNQTIAISKMANGGSVSGSRLIYGEAHDPSPDGTYFVDVKSCKLNGKDETTILKDLTVKKVYYVDVDKIFFVNEDGEDEAVSF